MSNDLEDQRTVALVGLRCSGKSSVGRRLATLLALPFVDLDDRTAARGRAEGASALGAGELLEAVGLEAFRRIEAEALDEVLDGVRDGGTPCVLATGGGVVETAHCRARLAREAKVAWLSVDPTELGRRLRADPTFRPSLTGADPADELAVLLKRRDPLFREVTTWKLDCEGRGIDDLAADIHALLRPSRPR